MFRRDNTGMQLTIAPASNFRDLAAHATGVLFLCGVLYRSDYLGALDANDARQIAELGVRRVLDFRGVDERTSAACVLGGAAVHSLPIEPTIVQVLEDLLAAGTDLSPQDVVAHMQDTYRGFVRRSTPKFAEFFSHLLESNEPTVFHCTAGKDRTGFAAALVLHALGASHDTVLRDYMHTNDRLKPLAETGLYFPRHVTNVLYRVQPEFLNAAYEAVEQDFGNMENYLREGIGLRQAEHARLRELYLQP